MDTLPDDVLVVRAQQGDPEAFDLLTGKYRRRLGLFIAELGARGESAGRLTQEVFREAARHLPGFRAGTSFENWLLQLGLIVSLNRLKAGGPMTGED